MPYFIDFINFKICEKLDSKIIEISKLILFINHFQVVSISSP